ncbi:MAG: bifunctional helix-turn-helix transcriptional regulator/GNAT family N-acetyltransferase [Thermoanaerobaculia bacterium]
MRRTTPTAAPKERIPDRDIAAVRLFNRFYTRQIGLLREGHLDSPFSLTEVRVLYELAHQERPLTATDLCLGLGLDAGYVSRMLAAFEKRGFVGRTPSRADGRRSDLALTPKGRAVFAPLDAQADTEVAATLVPLSAPDRTRLVGSMKTVESILRPQSSPEAPVRLRQHRPGDMGWVVHRHGVLYRQEYGWDERFEALVAEIVAKFIQEFDPARDRCWVAERGGEILGSVFIVNKSQTTAKLRLLLVEPSARGLGLGAKLISECIRFARRAGYRKITLWTNDNLSAARHLYEKAGFRLVASEPHSHFGKGLVGETWELRL